MTNTEVKDDQERWIDKIQKLLAKAERAGSEQEAESFFTKAQELMTKHMIDEVMLAAASGKHEDKIVQVRVDYGSTYWQAWRNGVIKLGTALGFHNLLSVSGKNGFGYWVGWKSEVEMGEILLASLQIQVERAARRFMDTYQSPPGSTTAQAREDRYKAKRSFIEGYISVCATRIQEQRMATLKYESKERGQSDGSLLPVLMDRDAQLKAFFQEIAGKPQKIKSAATNIQGHAGGRAAGKSADIGQPRVGGNKRALNA